MTVRIERLRAELERVGAASFLGSSPTNVEYLTGFASTNAFAVVGRDRVVVATDGRYIEAAHALEGIEVVLGDRELAADVGRRLPDVAEPPVAFESSHLTYAGYEAISASGLELRPVARLVEGIRSVKDADELDAIRRAARITTTAYERLADESVVGRTEREVAWRLAQALHDEGAEDVAFPLIVASGPNAAVPHHHSGDRRIEAGETVIVDAGAKLDGYCSDCTRTFATGALPHDVQRAYEACLEEQ